jgi:radical SAM superfamily enzyme YgiQ (UPF0313 family)
MASLCLARLLKERFPHLRIAFGGANCETVMGEELHRQYPFIDFVASGEADRSFPALMCALRAGGSLSNIKGVVRRDNGSSVVAGRAEIVRDMDSVPYPDFDDYFRQFHWQFDLTQRIRRLYRSSHRAGAGGVNEATALSAASTAARWLSVPSLLSEFSMN